MAQIDHGNLAYKLPMRDAYLPAPNREREFEAERRRRERARAALIEQQRVRQTYRFLSSMRARRVFAYTLLILASTAIVAFPVWRNAKIIEANYANVRVQNEIRELQQDISVREGQMLKINNLLNVRDKAIHTLGMQTKTADQVHSMKATSLSSTALLTLEEATVSPDTTIENYVRSQR